MRRIWPLLLVALTTLSGCTHAPPANAITKIVLSRSQCEPQCRFFQLALYPDGRMEWSDDLSLSVHARLDARSYRDLVAYLLSVPAFGPRWNYLAYPNQEPSTTIWTEYSGRHWQVTFPTESQFNHGPPPVVQLNKWAEFAAGMAGSAVYHARRATMDRLNRVDMLQRVIFNSHGCFGTCPAYAATFNRDGSATLRGAMFVPGIAQGKARNLRADVSFDKVVSMLKAYGFAQLKPRYPLRVIDEYGVSFEFDYRDGYSYTVEAPDRTQWPPEVAALVGAFSQLVRDTNWTSR